MGCGPHTRIPLFTLQTDADCTKGADLSSVPREANLSACGIVAWVADGKEQRVEKRQGKKEKEHTAHGRTLKDGVGQRTTSYGVCGVDKKADECVMWGTRTAQLTA